MLFGMIGRSTAADTLKEGLDTSVNRTRLIASRVAQASVNGGGFAIPVDPLTGAPAEEATDIETEMTSLADEQLRYDATAKLLQKTYEQMRMSLKG